MLSVEIEKLACECYHLEGTKRVVYMIYPALVPLKKEWVKEMSEKYSTAIVVIYIPADGWNDMLTPWAEPGETPDSPPFAGHAAETLKTIQDKVVPETMQTLGLSSDTEKDLLGVSLSGLFTLWQWIECDEFKSIACLSGSFWYDGFMEWFEKQTIPVKTGKAYFLLGVKEPKAWIKAYRTVGEYTERIVEKLKGDGIPTIFQWVPGDHFADTLQRAEEGLKSLCD